MPRLTDQALAALAERLPHWSVSADELQRRVALATWAQGLQAVQAIGSLADQLDHHPALRLQWGRLELTWSTHDAGGVTELDVNAALRSDDLLKNLVPGAASAP